MPSWREKYPGVEALKVAVMGCIVNGPGESKHADIGISLPGTGEQPAAPVFIDGKKAATLARPGHRRGVQEDGRGVCGEAVWEQSGGGGVNLGKSLLQPKSPFVFILNLSTTVFELRPQIRAI